VSHDPRVEIEKLRGQLSSHDTPLAFLFGAGTSCCVDRATAPGEPLVPPVAGLTALCETAVSSLSASHAKAWADLSGDLKARGLPVNVETVLSQFQMIIDALPDGQSLLGLTKTELIAVTTTIRGTIGRAAHPSDADIPKTLPHDNFAGWVAGTTRRHPVEVFTTNYDILIERALEAHRQPVFDGFVGSYRPFFHPASLSLRDVAPGVGWTRVWKIHGSINWHWDSTNASRRIVRTEPADAGELILPSHYKYDESRKQPYLALLDRLSRFLTQENAVLVTCGYSFGDQHINSVLFDALDNHPRTHIFGLRYAEPGEEEELVRRALARPNFLIYGPATAVVDRRRDVWRLLHPVDDATAGLIDVAFDSDAQPEPDKPALTGRCRLGDFNFLARFLASLLS